MNQSSDSKKRGLIIGILAAAIVAVVAAWFLWLREWPAPRMSDSGATCINNADCEASFCVVDLTEAEKTQLAAEGQVATTGTCPEYEHVMGCYYTISDGVVTDQGICFD